MSELHSANAKRIPRCEVCGRWLSKDGCVPGNCSTRPRQQNESHPPTRPTMPELSASRIGQTWTAADHEALVHHLAEIDRTAVKMAEALRKIFGRSPLTDEVIRRVKELAEEASDAG